MKQNPNQSNGPALRGIFRVLGSRIGIVVGVAFVMLALAGFARLHPLLAQTPADPTSPAAIATVDTAAFAASADPDHPAYVPGELLVGMQASVAAQAASGASVAGFTAADVVTADAEVVTHLVSVPVGDELAAAQLIAQQPGVLYVEPNAYVYAAQDGLVPAAQEPMGSPYPSTFTPAPKIINDDFYASQQWNMQRIGMARAWQLAFDSGAFGTPSTQIVVAVVDSGIDPAHPEFAGRLLPGKNYVELTDEPQATCREPRFAVPMLDTYGHGTFVSGIIAASMNNSTGVAGVAPMVKIDPRRALNCNGGGSIADVSLAIREAADAGADIINLSLVVGTFSQTLADAVEYAADKGALLIAASGNVNSYVYYPAAFPEVIAVGALGYYDAATTYSNHGPEIALAAPGGDAAGPVFSTWPQPASFPLDSSGQPRTRCPGIRQDGASYYCTGYGTSFAAPAVAGVAALMLSLDPALTPARIREVLVMTATPLPSQTLNKVGAGKLNAFAAVRALLRSGISFYPAGILDDALRAEDPYTLTVRIQNPSATPLAWKAQLDLLASAQDAGTSAASIDASAWLSLTSGTGGAQNGSAAHGAPGFLTLRVDPAALSSGINASRLTVEATPPGRSKLIVQSNVLISLGELLHRFMLPFVMQGWDPGGTVPTLPAETIAAQSDGGEVAEVAAVPDDTLATDEWVPFAWATPDNPAALQTHAIATNDMVAVSLPFTVAVKGDEWQSLIIHENGFVVLPNAPLSPDLTGANRCMPMTDPFGTTVFGWWADLDASASGAKITSFAAAGKRYVVQYENVPVAGASQNYSVTFQIVLDQQGNIRLNYESLPLAIGKPVPATVGAQVQNGRFYSEILCSTATQTFGDAPKSQESLLIRSADLY